MVARRRRVPKGAAAVWLALLAACGASADSGESPGDAPPESIASLLADDDFHEMGKPMPGDWLAEFDESGQTYAQWVRSPPNWPNGRRRIIYIQPIGELGPRAPRLEDLARYVEIYFGLPVRTLPTFALEKVEARSRRNPELGHHQVHAGDILDWMEGWLPDDAYAVIGLTGVDLYPDDEWNFVFGVGMFKERVGIYSLARYMPEFYDRARDEVPGGDVIILRRTLKVMAHEIGHMFGIRHCTHYECVMNGTNSLGETDRRPVHMCPLELRKLHAAVGLDLRERYRALSTFYREHGLEPEAEWTARRATRR